MAKIKRGAKLGDIVGRRHPVAAAAMIILGALIGLSMLDFASGQEIFFKPYFEPFIASTQSAGANICGKFGATFCTATFLLLGGAAYMIPVYLIWLGAMCFKRSASAVSKGVLAASLAGLLLFSVLWSVIQAAVDGAQSASFPSGWGGKFGALVFDNLLRQFLNITGSGILVGTLYLACVVFVFVESPAEAAKELVGAAKATPSLLWKLVKFAWAAVAWLPKKLLSRRQSDDDEEAPLPRRKKMAAKAKRQTEAEAQAAQQADETADTQAEQQPDKIPEEPASQETPDAQEEEKPAEPEQPEETPVPSAGVEIDAPISDFSSRFDDDENDGKFFDDFEKEFEQTPANPSFTEAPADIPQTSNEVESPAGTPKEQASVEAQKSGGAIDLTHVHTEPQSKPAPAPAAEASSPTIDVVRFKEEKVEFAEEETTKNGYVFPSIELLAEPQDKDDLPEEDYDSRIAEIVNVIGSFGVKVLPDHAYPGPVITRYEVKPAAGVKISRIANLEDDITAGIKAQKVRIIAPVPGRGTVGIEVPNIHRQNVSLREVLQSKQWRDNKFEIPLALGKDAVGEPIVANLKKMTHALIAGSTNSGKSVCINTIIVSMLYKMTPEDLRLIMIDPKMVELQGYNSIPHMLIPVVSDVKKAAAALKWLTAEMMRRYQIFNKTGVRNIDGFNAKILKDKEQMREAEREFAALSPEERQAAIAAKEEGLDENVEIPKEKLPYIVCIIDELADLMSVVGKEVELYIARITQLARAAGIHMIIATQRPDVKVITGLIKNNLPTRIAFKVTSQIDSRTILDRKGAESLIGWGDMLFLNNGTSDPVRAQGAYLSDGEIESIVEALKVNGEPQYAEDVQSEIDKATDDEDDAGDGGEFGDPMIAKAVGIIRETKKTSISFLQRKLGVGYNRAANIVEELEERGLIGPDKGQGQRDIFI